MLVILPLAAAQLDDMISHPLNRYEMPMSTLIASEEWRLEAPWDGMRIGDVQVYKRNQNWPLRERFPATPEGQLAHELAAKEATGTEVVQWVWWAAVPCARIKSYSWLQGAPPRPPTQADPRDAQREKKADKSGQAGAPAPF